MNANAITLQKMEAQERGAAAEQRRLARVAGLLYLIIIVAGIFAEVFVRQSLIVPGDAAATAVNIMGAESLFRTQIAADLIMIISDIALALVFYVLFKAVSRSLSLLAAFFRLGQAAILGMNLLNLFFALQLLSGESYLVVVGTEQLQALTLLFLNAHSTGYALALVFFAVNLLVLGYLVIKSGFMPKVLGYLLFVASLAYLVDAFARVLLTDYGDYANLLDPLVIFAAFIPEVALCLYLLVKGVRVPQGEEGRAVKNVTAEQAVH